MVKCYLEMETEMYPWHFGQEYPICPRWGDKPMVLDSVYYSYW